MQGRSSDPTADGSLIPFATERAQVYSVQHGVRPPLSRIFINWAGGNRLHVACLRSTTEVADVSENGTGGGKVVEVLLGGEKDGDIGEAERRRIAYGSVPPFALLQSKKNAFAAMNRMNASMQTEWLQDVLEYSKQISDLLGCESPPESTVIEDPSVVLEPIEESTSLKAAWQLMETFYVDKQSTSWLPECLADWLADYDRLLSSTDATIYSKLVNLQKKLINLQIIEDDSEYWDGISLAVAVGWLDVAVKLLRLHGSYHPDQVDIRETENGLVEAVAVIISKMPRFRPDLPTGKLGQCFRSKPDFIKAWELWRNHITKLDCSAFWVQCGHQKTCEGLKNLLQIMLGNSDSLSSATCHWMELLVSHFLYTRPFTVGLEGMNNLAQKCMQLKSPSSSHGLADLLIHILGEHIEVVLAECAKEFGPWMVAHAMELLTAGNYQADILFHEERYNLGGICIEELQRLLYGQFLSSHPLTWQIAPTYLASCPKQGLGLLEILLYKQPVKNYRMVLKNLEICRLYELENISSNIMKIAGIYHWKHGRKGSGIYWLQQAGDGIRLNKIAQKLYDSIGKSISDDSFKQWEGLIELLGTEVGSTGGLEFLHSYRDFKKSLQLLQDGKASNVARQTVEALIQIMRNPSTPQRFWLPLLHDSVKLLNWQGQPILNVAETSMLLSKLQELSMAKLRPDFGDVDLPPQALTSVRLALASNLGRAILEES